MKPSEKGERKATRQCWECLKHRLVCDHTLPHCKKCQKAGKDCPGYGEKKPLQWVETGKVTSRRRRKDAEPIRYKVTPQSRPQPKVIELPNRDRSLEEIEVSVDVGVLEPVWREKSPETQINRKVSEQELSHSIWKHNSTILSSYLKDDYDGQMYQEYAAMFEVGNKEVNKLFAHGGKEEIEEIVRRGDHEEAAKFLDSDFPLQRLERILRLMKRHELPSYNYLNNETNEVVQAVNYYNVRIHPMAMAAGELAPNPALIHFPLKALHVLPPAIHHTLVCLAVNHYIHTLPSGAEKSVAVVNRSKVWHHRGQAISALSQYVGRDKTRCSDLTIASILMFMSMELQNPLMTDWRSHAKGMQQLVDMRGGLRSLIKQAPHLGPTVIVYVLIVTMANTCSPSWDQIEMADTPEKNARDIEEMYNLMFPYTLCPPALFLNILKVNHLRNKASSAVFLGDLDPVHCLEAQDLLSDIESFIPEDWAQPGERYDEWLLIGTIYQSAAALYCTMALQSLTILPNDLEMNTMRTIHGDRLQKCLQEAIKCPRLNHFLMWPMTVAGVEAGFRDSTTQYWIEQQFALLSRTLGTSSPLKAQAVMRRYWQKEEPGWDECFDRPYVFVI